MASIQILSMKKEQNAYVPKVEIIPTEPWHISKLKSNLRPEDAAEILRFGISIQHALWRSYKRAVIRKTALIDGEVVAIWGCGGVLMGKTGVPWLLTSCGVKKISPLKFARIYQDEVKQMLNIFPILVNYVDSEYDAAIRLLDIVDFSIDEPQRMGMGMYRRFWIKVSHGI